MSRNVRWLCLLVAGLAASGSMARETIRPGPGEERPPIHDRHVVPLLESNLGGLGIVEQELSFQNSIVEDILNPANACVASFEQWDCPVDGYRSCDAPGSDSCGSSIATSPDDERIWNVAVLVGNEYDSNIGAFPDFDGLGSVEDKDDNRVLLAAFGDLRLVDQQCWNMGLVGSVFSSFHFDQDDFNLQDYMGGVYANRILTDGIFAGIRYEFHETRLGASHLASDNRLVSNLNFLHGEWGHTTAYYELSSAALGAPALIPAMIQSGVINALGVTHAIYTFDENGRVYLGYRHENTNTDGDDFERSTNMFTVRAERPLLERWMGDAEIRLFKDDYKHPNSLDYLGRPRDDSRVEFRLGVQRNLPEHWAFRLDYTLTDTNSNVQNSFDVNFYEYTRHIVSTQVIYEF